MSTRERTVYSCDRCHAEALAPVSADGRQLWPDMWCLVRTTIHGSSEFHLCSGCEIGFRDWMARRA